MNRDMTNILRLAAVQALALGLAFPAVAGQSHQQAGTDSQVAQSRQSDSTQQAAPSTSDATTKDVNTGPQNPRGKDATDRSNAKKHPPTAQMDAATPTEKSGGPNSISNSNSGTSSGSGTSGNDTSNDKSMSNDKSSTANRKHPPTNAMDRAAPDEKSPAGSTAPGTTTK